MRIIEDWKQALDDKKYIAAILMDLSKAFDCLPHDLLLLKLKYYGLSDSALKLMERYLTNRKQRYEKCLSIYPQRCTSRIHSRACSF